MFLTEMRLYMQVDLDLYIMNLQQLLSVYFTFFPKHLSYSFIHIAPLLNYYFFNYCFCYEKCNNRLLFDVTQKYDAGLIFEF